MTTRFDFDDPDHNSGPRRLFTLHGITPELVRLAMSQCSPGQFLVVAREQLPTHAEGTERRVRAQNTVSSRVNQVRTRLIESGLPAECATRTYGNVITAYLRATP